MRASRGMGAISPSKMPDGKKKARRDDTDFTQYAEGGLTPSNPGNLAGKYSTMPTADLQDKLAKAQASGNKTLERALAAEQDIRAKLGGRYAKGGEVWDKPRPKGLGAPKPMAPAKKAKAKAMAKAAGRPYPNMVDNIRAARSK